MKYTNLIKIVCFSSLFLGCSVNAPAKKSSGSSKILTKDSIVNLVGQNIPAREKVSTFLLDGVDFKVDSLRVGKQAFVQSEVPRVDFVIPEQGDYIEILRCNENATAIAPLINSTIGIGNSDTEEQLLRTGQFWQNASESNQCLLLTTSASGNSYLDISAPNGSYRYLARTCVEQSRLIDVSATGSANCSKQVILSTALKGYVNLRADQEIVALGKARLQMQKADNLGRKIYFLTIDYNNALIGCEAHHAKNDIRAKEFENISQIIGMGVSLGYNVLKVGIENGVISLPKGDAASTTTGTDAALTSTDASSTSTDVPTAKPEASTTTTTTDTSTTSAEAPVTKIDTKSNPDWKKMWGEVSADVPSQGAAIGTWLNRLYINPSSYLKTCRNAEEIQTEAKIATLELQTAHEQYLLAKAQAEQATKARATVGK